MTRWVLFLLLVFVVSATLCVRCGPYCLERCHQWKATRHADAQFRQNLVCEVHLSLRERYVLSEEPQRSQAFDLLIKLLSRGSRGKSRPEIEVPKYLLQYRIRTDPGTMGTMVYQISAESPWLVNVIDPLGENDRCFALPNSARYTSASLPEYDLIQAFVKSIAPDPSEDRSRP